MTSKSSFYSRVYSEVYIEDILDSFVDLESLAINGNIQCCDTNRSYPKLKHLFLASVSRLPYLPFLESLQIACGFLGFKPWIENNFGRSSKRCEIHYPFYGDPDDSFQCLLLSLLVSLEYLKTDNFFGYSRQFKPMFPKLMEVSRVNREWFEDNFDDYGYTEFIDFLKDHRLTLKKVTTSLYSINDEQLKDMLSCLPHGTHITILPGKLECSDQIRQFGLIGGLCRDRNLYLEIDEYTLNQSFCYPNRFLDIFPPETQSLTLYVSPKIHSLAYCRQLIREILLSPLRSTILCFVDPTQKAKRTLSTAIQGLPETHKAILEWFEPKSKRVIIRRRN